MPMTTFVARPGTRTEEVLLGEILDRHRAAGVAIGVVRADGSSHIRARGFADVDAGRLVTADTVFRIASITKLFTAVAVLQLHERGLIDLDAPAGDYLGAYRLASDPPGFSPPTVRHLLTHTSGIPDVVYLGDLLHPGWGSFGSRPAVLSVRVGERLPSLAAYYRGALRYVVEPGTRFAYSNHGFATLGQIVEDVTGITLDRYLREHLFGPLGMVDTALGRAERLEPRLATGYEMRADAARPVPERDWITAGASGVYASARDLARFAVALLRGGEGILHPDTAPLMFAPHFQPDPRVPGIGLGFFRGAVGGHRLVGHDGRLPGFNSDLLLAPDDGIGAFVLASGSPGATSWMPIELQALLGTLVGAEEEIPHRADAPSSETREAISGRYQLPPRVADLRGRLAMGGGVEVLTRGAGLIARLRLPVPALYRGLPLEPASDTDPGLFRLDLSRFGMPVVTVAFSQASDTEVKALHTDLGCLSLYERPTRRGSWRSIAVLAAGVAAAWLFARRRAGSRVDTDAG
jgi:CubicO group peptidase (beta-lactamase class C family)